VPRIAPGGFLGEEAGMTTPFVRPDVQALMEMIKAAGRPGIDTLEPPQAREVSRTTRSITEMPLGELAVIRDVTVDGAEGPIGARLFDAREERGPGDLIIYLHGGGFVIGDLDSHAPLCAEIARAMDLPVLSIDYRLAPEHPFPAAPEDSIAAVRWAAAHSAKLGRPAERLILMGDSAGANLAIVTAVALRDAPAAVPVAAQCLIYPVTDTCRDEGSGREFGEGYFLTRSVMDWFDSHYRASGDDPRRNPHVAGLAGLPPTIVMTASLDPLRDQGRILAAGLAQVGVDSIYLEARGTIHGFMTMRRLLPSAQVDLERCLRGLKLLLDEKGGTAQPNWG
jgi:acetyl esterase